MENSVRNLKGRDFDPSRCSHCGGVYPTENCFKKHRKYKGNNKSPFNSRNSNNKCTECNSLKPNMCFRCELEDHLIANCPTPYTLENKVRWNMENNKLVRTYQLI